MPDSGRIEATGRRLQRKRLSVDMDNQGTKVVVNEAVRDLAGAYLWMGKALEAHDPQRDRWSEPADFGDSEQRRKRAEAAIERALSLEVGLQGRLAADHARFRTALGSLRSGEPFGPEHQELLRSLRRRGMALFSESVSRVEQAGSGG